MAKKDKKDAKLQGKTLDPGRAAVYGSILALVSAVAVAFITNLDKFHPQQQQKSQENEIVKFQEHKYEEVSHALDERAKAAEEERSTTTDGEEKKQLDAYLKTNAETKLAVMKKHGELKAAAERGDTFSMILKKTEVNDVLSRDTREFNAIGSGPSPHGLFAHLSKIARERLDEASASYVLPGLAGRVAGESFLPPTTEASLNFQIRAMRAYLGIDRKTFHELLHDRGFPSKPLPEHLVLVSPLAEH